MCWINLVAALLMAAPDGGEAFAQREEEACREALAFYAVHEEFFARLARGSAFSPAFLFGIVAPELTRYCRGVDLLETRALKVLYVQGGTAYANFSVGHFQMKPSFAERLEDSLRCRPWLHARFGGCLVEELSPRAARVVRLGRLMRLEMQGEYLLLFCTLVEERFRTRRFASGEDRLRFFAAAYNTGFHEEESVIEATGKVAFFPRFSPVKFGYADIAAWFWRRVGGDCHSRETCYFREALGAEAGFPVKNQ
jgi:hypothetical protein